MNLDKGDENFRGQIKVCLMLEDSKEPKSIVFWDNGCGMDRDDFQAYGTFAYSQEARDKDSANKQMKSPSKTPAKIERENDIRKVRRQGDPLTLTGNIGHFGVGAQNAVFYMGDMEHVMSRAVTASGKTPVEDMVISSKEMHEKYEKGDRKTVYDFPVKSRALGDAKLLREQELHQGVTDMITAEQTLSTPHFSMFVVSGIHKDHHELLKDACSEGQPNDRVKELVQDVARIYNYYLWGTDDATVKGLDISDSENENSEEDEDQEEDGVPSHVQGKRKGKQGASSTYTHTHTHTHTPHTSSKKLKQTATATGILHNIDMQFFFHGPTGERTRTPMDLRDEHKNMEFRMRHKMRDRFSFNLVLPDKGKGSGHKVTVRLYYFPKILDKETRPYDKYEEQGNLDRPIISCYWEGRWIPYAQVDWVKKVFDKVSKDTMHRHLLRRLRGSIFFPHSFVPTHNKLSLQQSPQAALDADLVRVMKSGSWDNDDERGVSGDFERWLKDCQKKYDRDIKFGMLREKDEPKYDSTENRTTYDKVTYGFVEYKKGQKISITLGKPHMFGEILSIWREGDTVRTDGATYTGYIQLKRYPLENFGTENNSFTVAVTRLRHKFSKSLIFSDLIHEIS